VRWRFGSWLCLIFIQQFGDKEAPNVLHHEEDEFFIVLEPRFSFRQRPIEPQSVGLMQNVLSGPPNLYAASFHKISILVKNSIHDLIGSGAISAAPWGGLASARTRLTDSPNVHFNNNTNVLENASQVISHSQVQAKHVRGNALLL
jgi:hypothetical protein